MQQQINELSENLEECKTDVHEQFKKGHTRMDTLEQTMESIEGKIDTVLEFHNNFAGFFKVMGWIGKAAVWGTKISAFVLAMWYLLKDYIK